MTGGDPMSPRGAIPGYVPPHLRGKVWDFRNEPDGRVSFLHPEAALGLSPEDSRVTLDADGYMKTFDPAARAAGFTGAMNDQYAPLQRAPQTSSRKINDWIGDKLRSAYQWGTSTQGRSVGSAALASALLGGLGGYAWGSRSGSPWSRAILMSLLAGGLGAAGTALAQRGHNAREGWLAKNASIDAATGIIRILEGDPSLSSHDRAMILRAITRLGSGGKSDLYGLLKTTAGVGAGALAMRFLGAKGLMPLLAGGIIGGLLASPGGLARNALGQVSITNYM